MLEFLKQSENIIFAVLVFNLLLSGLSTALSKVSEKYPKSDAGKLNIWVAKFLEYSQKIVDIFSANKKH